MTCNARRLWMLATALLLAVLHATPQRAHAQSTPHPVALPLPAVTDLLADAGVKVPPQVILDAYSAYLDGYLPALAKADAGLRALLAQMRVTGDPVFGPRDATRFIEVERASMEDERLLAEALLDAVAAHATGQEEAFAAARKLLALEVLQTHLLNKGIGSRMNRLPGDIRGIVTNQLQQAGVDSPSETEAKLRKVALAFLDERVAATRAYAEACQAHRVEIAKRAERLGLAGLATERAWAMVGKKAEEARQAAGTGKESWDASNRVYDEYDLSGLVGASVGPLPSHPACIAYLKVQLKACKEALNPMSDEQKTAYARSWFASLIGADDSRGRRGPSQVLEGLPIPPGAPTVLYQGASGYAYALARIENVTPETHAKLVALGDAWMADDREIIIRALERMAATGIYEDVRQVRRERAERAVDDVADILSAPAMRSDSDPGRREFPNVKLAPSLSAEEQRHYGLYFPPPAPRSAATSERARTWSFATSPLEYTQAVEADLCSLLRLTDDQRMLIATVFADARERWSAQVEPLAVAGREISLIGNASQEARDEFNAKLNAAFAKSTECFVAALASDQALFAALRAALGPAADGDAMTVAQLSRRTLEAFGSDYDDGRRTDAVPLDVPRAVLEAQLSPAGRKAALAVIATSAKEWEALALQRRDLIRTIRLSDLTARNLSESGAFEASRRAREEMAEQKQKIDASWRVLAEGACAQIAAALSPDDAAAWNSVLLPLQWPKWYPVLRLDLAAPPERLSAQRMRLRSAGDQIMSCIEDVRARQESRGMWDQISSSRLQLFEAYINNLRDVALELLRAAAPPADASRIPRTPIQAALDRYTSRVGAAAAPPVP